MTPILFQLSLYGMAGLAAAFLTAKEFDEADGLVGHFGKMIFLWPLLLFIIFLDWVTPKIEAFLKEVTGL